MEHAWIHLAALLATLAAAGAGSPPGAPAELPDPIVLERPEELPPELREYMGRRIARTMHWAGAEWLLRETREQEENTALLLQTLDLRPGQVVADLGCGNGYLTLPMAERVGPTGRVWAVDLQPQMISLLYQRAQEAGLTNLVPVVCNEIDPGLPPRSQDLVLLVDVYHEVGYPQELLENVHASLAPGGVLVLVEFRLEDPEVPIRLLHKMSKAQIEAELGANDYALAWSFDGLPWQHVMAFRRADDVPDELPDDQG